MTNEPTQLESENQREIRARAPRSPLRRRARVAYLILCNTVVFVLLLEIGTRIVRTLAPRANERTASRADVPYALHPYFQTTYRPDADTIAKPFLAGWRTEPPDLDAPGADPS